MRDQVFTAPTVSDAVRLASEALGLPEASVRYIVLETETAGGRGIKPTPARIAVMLDAAARPAVVPQEEELEDDGEPLSVEEEIGEIVEEFTRVSRSTEARVEVTPEGFRVVLPAGMPPPVGEALAHVLEKVAQRDSERRQVAVESGEARWGRAHALREQALAAARVVRETGTPTPLPPLSAFERRLVHVALQDVPGIRTYSVGAGNERRVVVALEGQPDEPEPAEPAGERSSARPGPRSAEGKESPEVM